MASVPSRITAPIGPTAALNWRLLACRPAAIVARVVPVKRNGRGEAGWVRSMPMSSVTPVSNAKLI